MQETAVISRVGETNKVIWGYQRMQMFGAVALMSGDFNRSRGHCPASVGSLRGNETDCESVSFWESGERLGSASLLLPVRTIAGTMPVTASKIHRKNSVLLFVFQYPLMPPIGIT